MMAQHFRTIRARATFPSSVVLSPKTGQTCKWGRPEKVKAGEETPRCTEVFFLHCSNDGLNIQ
jgi:hypothetical protein